MLKKWIAKRIRKFLGIDGSVRPGEKKWWRSKTFWFVLYNVVFCVWNFIDTALCPLINDILQGAYAWRCDIPDAPVKLIAFLDLVFGPLVLRDKFLGPKRLK